MLYCFFVSASRVLIKKEKEKKKKDKKGDHLNIIYLEHGTKTASCCINFDLKIYVRSTTNVNAGLMSWSTL